MDVYNLYNNQVKSKSERLFYDFSVISHFVLFKTENFQCFQLFSQNNLIQISLNFSTNCVLFSDMIFPSLKKNLPRKEVNGASSFDCFSCFPPTLYLWCVVFILVFKDANSLLNSMFIPFFSLAIDTFFSFHSKRIFLLS